MTTKRVDIRTKDAAVLAGVTEGSFHAWAKRRAVRPSRQIRLGRTTYNLWDADEVLAATTRTPMPWRGRRA